MNFSPRMRGVAALLLCSVAATPFAASAQTAETTDTEERTSTLDTIGNIIVTGTKTQDPEESQGLA